MSSDETRSYDDYKTAVIDTTTPYDDDFKQINEYYRTKRNNKAVKIAKANGKKPAVKKKELPKLQLHVESNEQYDKDFNNELGKFKKSTPILSFNMAIIDWVKGGLSCIWGILLTILAIVDLTLNIPLVTIIFSVLIIAGAVFCIIKKFKLRIFPIIAIVIAAFCLLYSVVQGRRTGFMVDPATVPYNAGTTADGDDEADTDSDTVREDLKAFMNEYHTFVGNYVLFMQKFYSEPDNQKNLMDAYISIIDKYDYYAVKIEQLQASSMSAADRAYFDEMVDKCKQELAKVM